jgi:acetoin utilization deacetylase AcuC-like enzyme
LSLPIVYTARYQMDIGPHVFPTRKYSLVHAALLQGGLAGPFAIVEPSAASWEELALVHTAEYLAKLRDGTMSADDIVQLELPWSAEMVEAFRVMVGGTVKAARIACGLDPLSIPNCKLSIHVGGGLHHAFPNHGEGFCPFNDVAVAVRVLQRHGIARSAIVDLDVHHGNGTAFIFNPGGDPPQRATRSRGGDRTFSEQDLADRRVFTFSMHQQHNYPMWKPRGSLDIGLADLTHDDTYLRELERALPMVMASEPQCVFYLAGADPYEDDELGGLRLSREGLRQRDRIVVETVRAAGLPLVVTLAGGYARNIEDTVAIHLATIEEALRSISVRP